ncbi:carboxypeptidase-like regulatory domain-containing protein [Maribacter sp. 2304DJ31-5]|uniref:carboxypeptidase-like regulatory domain-containing protein n=1 Tax=Maribacter sp. 2304DJ31-5 TaxID=3386273 RepID=UPI0039BC6124
MKNLLLTFSLLSFSLSFAQDSGIVSGKILDAEMYNEPLLMAQVTLKNTEWSTRTNFNGNFEILDVTPGTYIIQITFLGYEPIERSIEIVGDSNIAILETLHAKSLSETGLYTSSKKNTEKETVSIVSSEKRSK